MSEIVFLVEEAPEGGFTARASGESIFTQADTLEALREKIRDAVHCHFGQGQGPGVIRLLYLKDVNDETFAASGGVVDARDQSRDPIEAWMDLMEVVDALCPRWPSRPITSGQHFLL